MTNVTLRNGAPQGYFRRLAGLAWDGLMQVVRPASHSRRAEAARAWAKFTLALCVVSAVVIIALMYGLDATEITWMPPRGTTSLWPIRIITDFGKSAYVTLALFVAMLLPWLLAPRAVGTAHATLIGFASRMQYVLLSVALANLIGEFLKGTIGRGRPFVGGEANAFHFSHFSWSEAYASFPSGHATTSCALAFAVAAVWPRWRYLMLAYAVVILLSRLVLLAHHASDVVAGALLGVVCALIVRYWFAARSMVFRIRADGSILARHTAPASAVTRALGAALAGRAAR